jgi:hypothetical protein
MALFEIDYGQSYVPESAIDRIKQSGDGYEISMRNGEFIRRTHGSPRAIETLPNNSRLEAVVAYLYQSEQGVSRQPILGWHIASALDDVERESNAYPILLQPLADDNEIVGILDPDTGKVTVPEHAIFDSIEQFAADATERLRHMQEASTKRRAEG